MPVNTMLFTSRRKHRKGLAPCLVAALWLGGCATPPSPVTVDRPEPATKAPGAIEPPPDRAPGADQPCDAERPSAPTANTGLPSNVSAVMAFADHLRGLSGSELVQELNSMGDPGAAPTRQMQAALVLMQLHQTTASARALGLLQRVASNPAPESAALKPLAQLLAQQLTTHLNDQRHLEDTVDRQAQQLRDSQRRIDILSDRLDAMRDIERSLTPRPPGRGPIP
jgi:hypothetical protein